MPLDLMELYKMMSQGADRDMRNMMGMRELLLNQERFSAQQQQAEAQRLQFAQDLALRQSGLDLETQGFDLETQRFDLETQGFDADQALLARQQEFGETTADLAPFLVDAGINPYMSNQELSMQMPLLQTMLSNQPDNVQVPESLRGLIPEGSIDQALLPLYESLSRGRSGSSGTKSDYAQDASGLVNMYSDVFNNAYDTGIQMLRDRNEDDYVITPKDSQMVINDAHNQAANFATLQFAPAGEENRPAFLAELVQYGLFPRDLFGDAAGMTPEEVITFMGGEIPQPPPESESKSMFGDVTPEAPPGPPVSTGLNKEIERKLQQIDFSARAGGTTGQGDYLRKYGADAEAMFQNLLGVPEFAQDSLATGYTQAKIDSVRNALHNAQSLEGQQQFRESQGKHRERYPVVPANRQRRGTWRKR